MKHFSATLGQEGNTRHGPKYFAAGISKHVARAACFQQAHPLKSFESIINIFH
jgi:hypothetical protein